MNPLDAPPPGFGDIDPVSDEVATSPDPDDLMPCEGCGAYHGGSYSKPNVLTFPFEDTWLDLVTNPGQLRLGARISAEDVEMFLYILARWCGKVVV